MVVERDVQLAMFGGREKAVGPILKSVIGGTNADLIAAVAPLYLTGSVLDVTYGLGIWWQKFKPDDFTFHDIELDGVDFRTLPHETGEFDTVCFDPPYVPRQGPAPAPIQRDQNFRERFGLHESRGGIETTALIFAGLAECARVSRRFVLVKCCDFTNGRQFQLGHFRVLQEAERLGLRCHDLIVHAAGTGPGGGQIKTVLRARRAHSYLIVLEVPARALRQRARAVLPEQSGDSTKET